MAYQIPGNRLARLINLIEVGENSDDCWRWLGAIDQVRGRPARRTFNSSSWVVARLAFIFFRTDWESLTTDLCVCHTCDNSLCLNPAHFFLGTSEENSYDRHAKGRTLRGENHGYARLTEFEVLRIKSMLSLNEIPVTHIAREFNVAASTIRQIKYGDTWKYLIDKEGNINGN